MGKKDTRSPEEILRALPTFGRPPYQDKPLVTAAIDFTHTLQLDEAEEALAQLPESYPKRVIAHQVERLRELELAILTGRPDAVAVARGRLREIFSQKTVLDAIVTVMTQKVSASEQRETRPESA